MDAVVGDGCHQPVDSSEPVACSYGLAAGPVVALVGDSHAAQWIPALAAIADEEGFALRTFTKSACPFADIVVAVGEQQLPYRACEEWNRRVVEVLLDTEELQFVVTSGAFWAQPIDSSGKKMAPSDAQVSIENGLVARWSELEGAGIDVVAIRDTPYPRFDVPECVAEHRDSLSECAFDRLAAMAGNGTQGAAAERTGATLVDMTDRICAEDECPAVVNGYLVWRDTHHLTATYSRALAGTLSLRIGEWTGFDRD